jgi:hypothetical protein
MKHLVLMQLQPGKFDDAAEQDYRETFAAIQAALPDEVRAVRVLRNTVARKQNMDVMIEMDLASPESLPKYLEHPLHRAIGARYNPYVVQIASFDYEE